MIIDNRPSRTKEEVLEAMHSRGADHDHLWRATEAVARGAIGPPVAKMSPAELNNAVVHTYAPLVAEVLADSVDPSADVARTTFEEILGIEKAWKASGIYDSPKYGSHAWDFAVRTYAWRLHDEIRDRRRDHIVDTLHAKRDQCGHLWGVLDHIKAEHRKHVEETGDGNEPTNVADEGVYVNILVRRLARLYPHGDGEFVHLSRSDVYGVGDATGPEALRNYARGILADEGRQHRLVASGFTVNTE